MRLACPPACPPAATEVALRTADLCYIPYQPTESDHDRATEAVSVRLVAGGVWQQRVCSRDA